MLANLFNQSICQDSINTYIQKYNTSPHHHLIFDFLKKKILQTQTFFLIDVILCLLEWTHQHTSNNQLTIFAKCFYKKTRSRLCGHEKGSECRQISAQECENHIKFYDSKQLFMTCPCPSSCALLLFLYQWHCILLIDDTQATRVQQLVQQIPSTEEVERDDGKGSAPHSINYTIQLQLIDRYKSPASTSVLSPLSTNRRRNKL